MITVHISLRELKKRGKDSTNQYMRWEKADNIAMVLGRGLSGMTSADKPKTYSRFSQWGNQKMQNLRHLASQLNSPETYFFGRFSNK